jgi:hypothetical protein
LLINDEDSVRGVTTKELTPIVNPSNTPPTPVSFRWILTTISHHGYEFVIVNGMGKKIIGCTLRFVLPFTN